MKKIGSLIKSYVAIILGTLLLLNFMNYFALGGGYIAIGVIAMILAAFFIGVGLITALFNDKISEKGMKLLSIIGMVSFPAFLFTGELIGIIDSAPNLPTAWVIEIISLIASIMLALAYLFASLSPSKALNTFVKLAAGIFVLSFILNILFQNGIPADIGDIPLVMTAIYGCFLYMLFQSIGGLEISEDNKEKE